MVKYFREVNVIAENIDENTIKATAKMVIGATKKEDDLETEIDRQTFSLNAWVDRGTFEITKVTDLVLDGFFPECNSVLPPMIIGKLKGLKIGSGYSKQLKELIGGQDGCTHMIEIMIEIGKSVVQAQSYYVFANKGIEESLSDYLSRSNIDCYAISLHKQNSKN